MSIEKKLFLTTKHLLKLINENRDELEDINLPLLEAELRKIAQKEATNKTCNPLVYCYYKNKRIGLDIIVPLSIYIACKVCDANFDTPETNEIFNVKNIRYMYCDERKKRREQYLLNMIEEPILNYRIETYHDLITKIESYMNTLEPLQFNHFNNRMPLLENYAYSVLQESLKTNNPYVALRKNIPQEEKYAKLNNYDKVEEMEKLSKFLTLMVHDVTVDIRGQWERDRKDTRGAVFKLTESTLEPLKDQSKHMYYLYKVWCDPKGKPLYKETHQRVKEILAKYQPDDPITFFNKNFQKIKEECIALKK